MRPTPIISNILENIALTYERIKSAIDSKVVSRGYNIIVEKYHPEAFGSRYVDWSNNKDSIRFVWDGKDGWFYLRSLDTIASDWRDEWKDLIYVPYDPREHDLNYVQEMQTKIVGCLG